jgi:uroporphyrinogen decarboxylase
MTDSQWEILLAVMDGKKRAPLPAGMIIDSPWLPGWAGISTLSYYSSDELWLQANLKVSRQFPEVFFLPGFWAEFGMCTEPSAFGARCVWQKDDLPFAHKVFSSIEEAKNLEKPNPSSDGLLPFVLERLKHAQPKIADSGHKIRFAVSRGPLNIASFLLGTTEFMMAVKTNPEETNGLLELLTSFVEDWLRLQAATFPQIEGIFLLDDLIGFLGEKDFQKFVLPYFKRLYSAFPAKVRFLHNDAAGLVTARHLTEMRVNLFNFSHRHTLEEIRKLAGEQVTLLGNIPPRDLMAAGTPEQVGQWVNSTLSTLQDSQRIILSCGGGMPPGVPTANLEAFCSALREFQGMKV